MSEVISGVGMHPLGRFADRSALDMAVIAVLEALEEASVDCPDVEAVYCGHMYAKTGAGQRLINVLGRKWNPVINVEKPARPVTPRSNWLVRPCGQASTQRC